MVIRTRKYGLKLSRIAFDDFKYYHEDCLLVKRLNYKFVVKRKELKTYMTTSEIITIGTEIILGQITDSNAPYIAKSLTENGIRVQFQTSVGDNKELLKSSLDVACKRVDLIIATGGLGPTENDVTRETVSDFFGVPLVLDEKSYAHIQKIVESRHRTVTDTDKKQALIPKGATVIFNSNGTAAGFAFRHGNTELVCLPGVPGEMKSMLRDYLETRVKYRSGDGCTLARTIHTFGISERNVEDSLGDCKEHAQMMTLVHDGVVSISILATAPVVEYATKILDTVEQNVRQKLGVAVFGAGNETLESAVAILLKKGNKTIAVAESCTGGLLSDKLTNVPGISDFFLEGVVAYSNRAKSGILSVPEELIAKHGAVSAEVARAMAEGIKKRSFSNIGVGITGIAGPGGATKDKPVGLVYIAVFSDGVFEVKELKLRGTRIDIKRFSAHCALNMVRLKLME